MDEEVLKHLAKQHRKFQEWLFDKVKDEKEFLVTLEIKDSDEKVSIVVPAKRVLDEVLEHKDPFEKSLSIMIMNLFISERLKDGN